MTGALEPRQLRTYFVLMESVVLLQHAVTGQLRDDGDLSYVQFELLARLADAENRRLTMTELADGVVYSRSGLTHQAELLEKAGLITRRPGSEDRRSTLVAITDAGLQRVAHVMPGHIEVVRRLLFDVVDDGDLDTLGTILGRIRDHIRAEPPRSARPRRRRA